MGGKVTHPEYPVVITGIPNQDPSTQWGITFPSDTKVVFNPIGTNSKITPLPTGDVISAMYQPDSSSMNLNFTIQGQPNAIVAQATNCIFQSSTNGQSIGCAISKDATDQLAQKQQTIKSFITDPAKQQNSGQSGIFWLLVILLVLFLLFVLYQLSRRTI